MKGSAEHSEGCVCEKPSESAPPPPPVRFDAAFIFVRVYHVPLIFIVRILQVTIFYDIHTLGTNMGNAGFVFALLTGLRRIFVSLSYSLILPTVVVSCSVS